MQFSCITLSFVIGSTLFLVLGFINTSYGSLQDDEECLACHGVSDQLSSWESTRFVDKDRFLASVHAQRGMGCRNCHQDIKPSTSGRGKPHVGGKNPMCEQCHREISIEYSKSLHFRASKISCISCHDPHYSVSFRTMSSEGRQRICLKCHDVSRTHRYLPHRELHFKYLECTSCHSVNAEIGLVLFLVQKGPDGQDEILSHNQLTAFTDERKSVGDNLDQDGDGILSQVELQNLLNRINEKGSRNVRLEIRVLVLTPTHNYSQKNERARDCTLCHSRDAKFYSQILIEIPEKNGIIRTFPVEKKVLTYLGQKPIIGDFYLLGESKIVREDLEDLFEAVKRIGFKWVDLIGVTLILMTISAICFHAIILLITNRSVQKSKSYAQVELPPLFLRMWHFVHGLLAFLLVLTGAQLRLPDAFPIFANFLNAVNLHNLSGTLLILNYASWLGYLFWKGEFKTRYYVSPRTFLGETLSILHYYNYLIFVHGEYPLKKEAYSPYDPLERAFFLTVMLIIVPAQILTGVLLLKMYWFIPVIDVLGGLRVIAAIHLLSGYILIVSLIMHLYFHTLKKFRKPNSPLNF